MHEVTIDVENLGPRPIHLEVRERVPIPAPDTDEVEVAIDEVVPGWEPWRPEPAPGQAALLGTSEVRHILFAPEEVLRAVIEEIGRLRGDVDAERSVQRLGHLLLGKRHAFTHRERRSGVVQSDDQQTHE